MIEIETSDGWTLKADRLDPPDGRDPIGVLWLGHAMMVNRRTMDRPKGQGLASLLAGHGFIVYSVDLRGHGDSGPRAHQGGKWSYDDFVLRDIPDMTRWVHEQHPDLPLGIVGHSLVAHCGIAALGQFPDLPVQAFVDLAGNVWLRRWEPSLGWWLIKRIYLLVFAGLTRMRGYFPARALKVGNEDEAREYVLQFAGFARRGWRSCEGHDYLGGMRRISVPVLGVTASKDRLFCRPESARRFLAELAQARVESWVVGNGEIVDFAPGHMDLVTDPRSRPLWHKIAEWLEQVLVKGTD